MRSRIFVVLALVTLAFAAPTHAEVLLRNVDVEAPGYRFNITFVTEEEGDSLLGDTPERTLATMQRAIIAAEVCDSLGIPDVMFVALIVTLHEGVGGLRFSQNQEYGIRRGDEKIPSLGLYKEFEVYPGRRNGSLIMFRRMSILPTDFFYISPRQR